jgi:hypothetical protein
MPEDSGQLTFQTMGGDTVVVPRRGRHYVQPRGYAYSPGTGPAGETCGSCSLIERHRRWCKCGHEYAVRKHTRGRASDILARSPACRYWEQKT